MDVSKRLTQLANKIKDKQKGISHALSIKDMPKTNYHFGGGIIPGLIYGITGDTAAAKTKYLKAILFGIFENFIDKKNKDFLILFAALEESEAEFIDSLLIHIYFKKYGEKLDYYTLNSYRQESVTPEQWKKILTCRETAQSFCNHILKLEADDPQGIFEECISVLKNKGIIEIKDVSKGYSLKKITDQEIIVVVDHMNLLKTEKNSSNKKYEAMEDWITTYCKKIITKQFGWACINVLQQSFDPNKSNIHTSKGEINPKRVEPSLDKLGNNKEISRDFYVIVGVFNPYYYGIKSYPNQDSGYDITILEDNFRAAIIIKHRFGLSSIRLPYLFEGASFLFKELPSLKEEYELKFMYDKLLDFRKNNDKITYNVN